jgi:DNA-binding response OmpR family regulator
VLRAEVLGRRRARVTVGGQRIKLTPKHSEILVLLLLNRDGLSSHELGVELYGEQYRPVTVRAEISRMRRLLGPALATRPYRLDAELQTDLDEVESLLEAKDPSAVDHYRGPLLDGSQVAAISSAREGLERRVSACREMHG